ncbi:Crp/Fnr family transcriptional regulator [Patescibacteria group bacterium]|nr:Crp/Fnr family transcriptional regulator [Patescibacteria group bacterium]
MDKNAVRKIDIFFTKFTPLHFEKNDVILQAGETPEGIYYITKGLVKQYLISKKGETFILHVFRAESFFHMTWFVNGGINTSYFEAMAPVDVYRAPMEKVETFFTAHPELYRHFANRLLRGVDGMISRLGFLMLEPAYVKIISFLVYLAQKYSSKEDGKLVTQLPFSHKEIASWVGTTRETASIQMERLKKMGIISYRRRLIVIHNLKHLQDELLSGSEQARMS